MQMLKSSIGALTFSMFVLFFPTKGFSWGDEGHSIVAKIAHDILTEQSKTDPAAAKALATVKSILGNTSFESAATWPDDVKSKSRKCTEAPYIKDPNHGVGDKKGQSSAICDAYKYTAAWHFINTSEAEYRFPEKGQGGNYFKGDMVILIKGISHSLKGEPAPVLNEVTSYSNWKRECLKKPVHNSSQSQSQSQSQNCKKEALEFLIHFMGDIHQPLHSGGTCDLGGNTQHVTFFGEEEDKGAHWCPKDAPNHATCAHHELHQAWDTNLWVKSPKNGFKSIDEYTSRIVKSESKKQKSTDAKGCVTTQPSSAVKIDEPNGPISWANESVCYMEQVYSFPDDSVGLSAKDTSTRNVAGISNQNSSLTVKDRAPAAADRIRNRCRADHQVGQDRDKHFSAIKMDQRYFEANISTINERLYWGGHRLAQLLKDIYKNGDRVSDF